MNDEQLEDLLRAAGRLPEPAVRLAGDLSQQVRRRKQRNERRRRRITVIAVLAGGYLAGLATTWLWSRAPSPAERILVDDAGPAAGEQSAAHSPAPVDVTHSVTPEEQPADHERQAGTFPRISAYESLRRLGDEYLYGKGDVATALVFYRRALDEASPHELAEPDHRDTWLLRSLKRDRLALSNNNQTGNAI